MGAIQDYVRQDRVKGHVFNIPLGTVNPWHYYLTRDKEIFVPNEDVVRLYITKRDQFSMLVIAGTGVGKCVTIGEWLITKKGIQKIEDINVGQEILSYNIQTEKQEFKPIIAKELNGVKEVYKVITDSNSSVKLTKNHPVFTQRGYVNVENLTTEDFVCLPYGIPSFEETPISIEEENKLYVMAYLIADGYLRCPNFSFTKQDDREAIQFQRMVQNAGLNLVSISDPRKTHHAKTYFLDSTSSQKLVDVGLKIALSGEKEIPSLLFTAPKYVKQKFIQILFDCDGSFHNSKDVKHHGSLEYCSKSKILIQQVHTLLLSFGILSRFGIRNVKQYDKNGVDYYRLSITDYKNLKLFRDQINFGLTRKSNGLDLYLASANQNFSNSKSERIPYEYCKHKTNITDVKHCTIKSWRKKGKSKRIPSRQTLNFYPEIHFDKIKEIRYIGPKETWDIQVEDNENFFAGNLGFSLVHNSRLFKRMLPYFVNQQNYKSLIFDCKGFEMHTAKNKTNDYKHLFPWEKPEMVELKSYMPAFVKKKAEDYRLFDSPENKFLRDFHVFSYGLQDVTDVLEASTLGMAPSARMVFLEKIRDLIITGQLTDTKEIIRAIRNSKMNWASKENLVQVFSFFSKEKFFDTDYPKINIAKDWKNGYTPCISLLEPEEGQASFYAGKIISDLYMRDAGRGYQKLLVVDDASKLLGSKMSQTDFLSVKKMIDTLTLGRYKKWNCIILGQSLDILNREIFPHIKYKIFGKLGSSDLNLVSSFCSPDVVFKIKTLRYDPTKQIKEMILVHPDNMTSTTFFPWGPLCSHP